MSYIFAFIIGYLFAFFNIFISLIIKNNNKHNKNNFNKDNSSSSNNYNYTNQEKKLFRQYSNFLNYSGSERGQDSLENNN